MEAMDRSLLRLRRFGATGPTLRASGEAGLLASLIEVAHESADSMKAESVVLRSGDDAAVLTVPSGRDLVVSQDAVVEDKDFRQSWITPYQLGRRALSAALSDIAGMGGTPLWCSVTYCVPATTVSDDVLAIQLGVCEQAAELGCAVVGGDVSDLDGPIVVDVAVGGTVIHGQYMARNAASDGDVVVVTGVLGLASAGLTLLAESGESGIEPEERQRWIHAQLNPSCRIAEGQALVGVGVRCGGDMSDGLLVEAERIASSSGCGLELWLDSVPVEHALREAFPERWQQLVLGGGEDFELIATVSPDVADLLLSQWDPSLAPLTVIGRVTTRTGVHLLGTRGGVEYESPHISSRHFA